MSNAINESGDGFEDHEHATKRASSIKNYLLKSEPKEYGILDLEQNIRDEWDGVRNYEARKHIRSMKVGDFCWFYHSSCKTPAIVGTCRIVREAAPDITAYDPSHESFDPKSTKENCRWDSVLVEFDSRWAVEITLKELRHQGKINPVIAGMMLLKRSRLSVLPVTNQEWIAVKELKDRKERGEDLTA